MPPSLIGGAISAGTSILGGILGSSAASKAAAQQAAAGKEAATQQTAAGTQAQNIQQSQISSERSTAQPYLGVGSQSASQLGNALQGPLGQTQNTSFSAPTAAQAEQTPGYQFQLQQGLNALENSAFARGGGLSTGTAKNLENYAQGVASTNYQNTYNNALGAYQTNFSNTENTRNNLFNRLYSTTGLGANIAANLNSATANSTNALTNGILGNATQVGSDIMGIGNVRAAGTVGSANALNAGISGAGNAISQGVTLQSILGAQNASNQIPGSPGGVDPTTGNALMSSGMFNFGQGGGPLLSAPDQTTQYGVNR